MSLPNCVRADPKDPDPSIHDLAAVMIKVGLAVSGSQAWHIAEIALSDLEFGAKSALLLMGCKAGAHFDPTTLTSEQIKTGVAEAVDQLDRLFLALIPPAGEA